jgi:hypothetical protein
MRFILLILILLPLLSSSQDEILTTGGEVIKCKIIDTTANEIKYKDAKDGWSYSSKYKYIKGFTLNGKVYNNQKEFLRDVNDINSVKPITYTAVVYVDSTISKEELFIRARSWFTSAFKDSKAVLEVQDKESGELIGKGNFHFSASKMSYMYYSGRIEFSIKVLLKDGRYKYEISDFYHNGANTSYGETSFGLIYNNHTYTGMKQNTGSLMIKIFNNVLGEIETAIESNTKSLISSLKSEMQLKSTKTSEW